MKTNKPRKDAYTRILERGINGTGFERFENEKYLIEGLKNHDYRWKLTFRDTGEMIECSSLIEAESKIKAKELSSVGLE